MPEAGFGNPLERHTGSLAEWWSGLPMGQSHPSEEVRMKRFAFAAAAALLVAGTQLHAQAAQGGQKTDSTKKKPAATASVKPAGAPAASNSAKQTPADTTKPKKKRSSTHK